MTPHPTRIQRTLLVEHFLDRFFDSELVSREAEARVTLAQILAALTIPGFVISALLVSKYAALAGGSASLAYLAALNDKCRSVVVSISHPLCVLPAWPCVPAVHYFRVARCRAAF